MGPLLEDDEVQDKSNKLLEQLGLHPAQLKAQDHLQGLAAQDNMYPGGADYPAAPMDKLPADPSLANETAPSSMGKDPNLIETQPNLPAPKEKEPFLMPSPNSVGAPTINTSDSVDPDERSENDYTKAHDEVDRMRREGSGIHQIHNPLLKGLAYAGDIFGRAFFPSVEPMIPGTEGHHQMLINTELGNENRALGEEAIRAKTAKERADAEPKPDLETFKESSDFEQTGGKGPLLLGNRGTTKTPSVPGLERKPVLPKGEGEIPLGADRVKQLNTGLATLYSSNPGNAGKSVPPEFQLPANATQKDFDRVDKLLEHSEKTAETAAQREQAKAMRDQMFEMRQEAQQDRISKEGRKMVIGRDASGRQVAMSEAEAGKAGLHDVIEVGAGQGEKIFNARNLLPLFSNQSDDPEDKGLLQIVDDLDKKGKLGVLASRWNEVLAGKVGAARDPEFEAFRTKWNLATTALMQVHVGNRGGAYLLEHFEDAVNAKKMNADTLRSGFRTEYNYIKHRAMLPKEMQDNAELPPREGEGQSKPAATKPAATAPKKPLTATKSQIQAVADKHKVPYADAEADFIKQGGKVTDAH